ncbi:MAG: MarC family protein [Sedimentisphaerales bacterium]|nr:MarC family protein [Planctomycetota bacterium]MDY0357058.1 MarC family protein [Sedimentisphaerales bacterium]
MLTNILMAFIPVFVAVDAIGTLPILLSLTQGLDRRLKHRIILQSMLTALCLAVGFILVGKLVFRALGILMGDFMIAGGVILFCLAIIDIVNPIKRRRMPDSDFGVVPLGTPLLAGPALLTTSMLAVSEYGLLPTLISVVANILLAGLLFRFSLVLIKLLGESGAKAMSKVSNLLLAAIAVMLIRKGLASFYAT